MLSKVDLRFLCKETKLPEKQTLILTEEEYDLFLVLESLSINNYSKKDLRKLSKKIYFTIAICKHANHISSKEKEYFVNFFIKYYDEIKKKPIKKVRDGQIDEKKAESIGQYFFSALAYHGANFKKVAKGNYSQDFYINHTVDALSYVGKKDFARSVERWMKVMEIVKKEGWL